MATYTPNYGLHQWVPEDVFVRTDFNTDLSKIDTALGAHDTALTQKCEAVFGSYIGNGAETRTITLAFTPKAVLVERQDGNRGNNNGGLAVDGVPSCGNISYPAITITAGGFRVSYLNKTVDGTIYTAFTNTNHATYCYMAFR